MQNEEKVQEYECKRNEVSYLYNVGAKGGTTPSSPNLEIMNQKMTRHQATKGDANTYTHLRTADQGIYPSIMQHEETVQECECKRNEVSYT